MSMLFAYMAVGRGAGGGGLEVLKSFVRGGQIFFSTCFVCVCLWGQASVLVLW